MNRDRFSANPTFARSILIIGAVVHFAACGPLYGRRGFPEVDPFWLAMVWLWVPAVPISAVFSRWNRQRKIDLAAYALVAGFVLSWATVTLIPNRKGPIQAIMDLWLFWPALLIGIFAVEGLSRVVLARMRSFTPDLRPYCQACGYCLRGLPQPRCPECGTSFHPRLLDPTFAPEVTALTRRWTTLLILVIVLATLTFPPLYRVSAFKNQRSAGHSAAEADWIAGTAIWYVSDDEMRAMTPRQYQRFDELWRKVDSDTGLQIERPFPGDWRHRTHQLAYRQTIEHKLLEAGRSRPSFD